MDVKWVEKTEHSKISECAPRCFLADTKLRNGVARPLFSHSERDSLYKGTKRTEGWSIFSEELQVRYIVMLVELTSSNLYAQSARTLGFLGQPRMMSERGMEGPLRKSAGRNRGSLEVPIF
eukprot:scaffold4599_cov219-Amphora_coffeaeformis.AAC.19